MEETGQNSSFTEYQNIELLMDMKEPEWLVVSSEEENEKEEIITTNTINLTPIKDDMASSPQFYTPHPKELILPFSTCNESPIDRCLIAASTPFQGQRILSTSSITSDLQKKIELSAEGNATFNFDKVSSRGNETFAASINESHHIAGGTFCKDQNNITYDLKQSEKDSGSDIMDTHLESSAESAEDLSQRKPLRAIPQPTTSANRTTTKKMSKLAAPRMNTAAISRIQARSPGRVSAPECKKSATGWLPKKPTSAGNATKARKSLLPPSFSQSTKSSTSVHSRSCSIVSEEPSNVNNRNKNRDGASSCTPTKRKAQESPKRMGRSPKFSGNRGTIPPCVTAPPSSRSSSAPTSRLTTTSTASRLQRPSGLKGPSSYSRSTTRVATASKSNGTSGSLLSTNSKSTTRTSINIHKQEQTINTSQRSGTSTSSALTSSGNLRKIKPKTTPQTKTENNSQCITALATLLDYVVNRLDGLSAPRLSEEKQQLQKLVGDKIEVNDTLSTRLTDLESRFFSATREYERSTKEKTEKYEREILEQRNTCERIVTQLTADLELERETSKKQFTALTLQQEEMKNEHVSELTRIEQEWKEEYEKLNNNMENTIQEELKEQIKPYINAKSEVESLSAVLDMKNAKIHKLDAQCSKYTTQRDEVTTLSFRIEQLSQKNEDLSMQLQEKMDETRNSSMECKKLQRSMNEEQNRSIKLRQHNEELQYRLSSMSPSPSPSFNPVFTTSPTMADPPAGFSNTFGSTPINGGLQRNAFTNSNSASYDDRLPRSLLYNNDPNSSL